MDKAPQIAYDDRQMLRGFTHEMCNMVTSNMLVLAMAMDDEVTLCHKNAEYLGHLFDLIEQHIPEDIRDKMLEYFQKLEKNEQTLVQVLQLLTCSNERGIDASRLASEYSRLGRIPVTQEPVNLQFVLEAVMQEHQEYCLGRQVAVRLTGSLNGLICCHKPHLHLLFTHIIRNACQAFEELPEARERVMEITLQETSNQQIVTIRDNATGIPEQHLSRIFEPFYTTKQNPTFGLGLSFVAKIVALYQGSIEVKSQVGQGTTFTLTFPLKP
jgi:histidine kinase